MSKEETSQKAAEEIQGKVLEWMNGLEEVAKNNSDTVANFTETSVELGFQSIVYAGIQEVIQGLIALAITIFFVVAAKKLGQISTRDDIEHEDQVGYAFCSCFSGAVGVVSGIVTLAHLASIWTYVMIFDPKLYVAYRVTRQFLDMGNS